MISRLATLAVAASLAIGMAIATPGHKTKTVSCPVCHMPISKTKNKTNTVAVRLKKGGPVMYCCAGCKMPDSVLVKAGKKHIKAVK